MSTQDLIVRFFADDGPLASRLTGYRARQAQIDMSLAVAESLRTPYGRLVVEAGTGTGKSLAYLAAALLSGKRVVVATGTKALQDQLFQKDIPLAAACVRDLTGKQAVAALMKGRSNYLCKLRWARFQDTPLFPTKQEATLFGSLARWAERTSTGDRAEMADLPDSYATWQEFDAGGDTCVGSKCAHYDDCFVTQMRKKAERADIIVVNHHLLCADQRVRLEGMPVTSEMPETTGAVSGSTADTYTVHVDDDEDTGPSRKKSLRQVVEEEEEAERERMKKSFAHVIPNADALIIDEAHALTDVATDHFGIAVSSHKIERFYSDVRKLGGALAPRMRQLLTDAASQGAEAGKKFFMDVAALVPASQGRLRLKASQVAESAHSSMQGMISALRAAKETCLLVDETGIRDPLDRLARNADRQALARRAQQLVDELIFLFDRALQDDNFVVCAEIRQRTVMISAAPIDVASPLSRTLWSPASPVILTSATLAVGESVTPFVQRIGLGSQVASHLFASPFDYPKKAALYAPSGMPEPDDSQWLSRFDAEALFLLNLTQGGALVLFTSHKGMEEAYKRLQPFLDEGGFVVRKQGEKPKMDLLAEMRVVDRELTEKKRRRGAVLFATHSFWEGVDVQGRALRLVIIDRLPFKVPTDPIQEARATHVRDRGGHPFSEISLPEAALTLKQGVGRLIRSHDDAGIVALLDGRLRSKPYGKLFLRTLPPMTPIGSQTTLQNFWQRFLSPALGFTDAGAAHTNAVNLNTNTENPTATSHDGDQVNP